MTDKMKQIYLSKSFYFVKELYFCNPYVLGYLEPNQGIQNQYFYLYKMYHNILILFKHIAEILYN